VIKVSDKRLDADPLEISPLTLCSEQVAFLLCPRRLVQHMLIMSSVQRHIVRV